MVFRDRGARGVPDTSADQSAHVFSQRPDQGGKLDAVWRPQHLLGGGTHGGQHQGVFVCFFVYRNFAAHRDATSVCVVDDVREPVSNRSKSVQVTQEVGLVVRDGGPRYTGPCSAGRYFHLLPLV